MGLHLINARALFDSPFPEKRFWIDNFLPVGGVALVGGCAKDGKSFMVMDVMNALAKGQDLFGDKRFKVREAAKILYLEREIKEFGVKSRLHTRNEIPSENLLIATNETRFIEECFDDITECVKEHDIDVIVIDPISRFMRNENDTDQVASIFRFIETLQQTKPELSVILIHHFAKPPRAKDDYDPLNPYNFRGPSRWIEAPDTLVAIKRVKGVSGEQWRLHTRFRTRHSNEKDLGNDGEMMLAFSMEFHVKIINQALEQQTMEWIEGLAEHYNPSSLSG